MLLVIYNFLVSLVSDHESNTYMANTVATCDVPRTLTTLGDRSFTAAGPHLWNNLAYHFISVTLNYRFPSFAGY